MPWLYFSASKASRTNLNTYNAGQQYGLHVVSMQLSTMSCQVLTKAGGLHLLLGREIVLSRAVSSIEVQVGTPCSQCLKKGLLLHPRMTPAHFSCFLRECNLVQHSSKKVCRRNFVPAVARMENWPPARHLENDHGCARAVICIQIRHLDTFDRVSLVQLHNPDFIHGHLHSSLASNGSLADDFTQ